MSAIRRVGVIGSGVMGSGIAAQIANAGVPVVLLDIVPPGANDRDAVAAGAVARALKAEPAPFMSPDAARLIETGNLEDHLAKLADCDWIIEVVVERLDVKQALYRRLDEVRRPGSVISSNTSTIPLRMLTGGMGEAFRRDFVITHFFNPPRYMRLLELVTGADTNAQVADRIAEFCDVRLGKSIVRCNDSPGFIANRLGIFWMQCAVVEAMDAGLRVEEVDALIGRPVGVPKTGVFGLMDLVGIDLGPHINASMARTLPPDDPFQAFSRDIPLIGRMIEQGLTGRKGKGGFYRLDRDGSTRRKLALDLATGAYRDEQPHEVPEHLARDIRALMAANPYVLRVMGQTMAYAAMLVPEAAGDIGAIDDAMRLGYNWKWGPFELIDRVGAAWLVAELDRLGVRVPALLRDVGDVGDATFYRVENGRRQYRGLDHAYHDIVRAPGVLLLADVKLASKPVLKNASAAVWDVGDGVLCFEFTSKANTFDAETMDLLGRTTALVAEKFRALVVYNEGENFSLGANLGVALFAANIAAWGEVDKGIAGGQQVFKALKYASFPVVVAPHGMALGGGCEIMLHADAIQAHAETYTGLVEGGVGLLPGWGGCGEMLVRWRADPKLPRGPMPASSKAFEMISTAQISKSAAQARAMHVLRETDGVTMNRDRLLADAKARALALAEDYTPPEKPTFRLPGASGRVTLFDAVKGFARRGLATPHDLVVGDGIAEALTGGDADWMDTMSEDDMLALERRVFLRLMRTPGTLARIEHTLETGKPLRN